MKWHKVNWHKAKWETFKKPGIPVLQELTGDIDIRTEATLGNHICIVCRQWLPLIIKQFFYKEHQSTHLLLSYEGSLASTTTFTIVTVTATIIITIL